MSGYAFFVCHRTVDLVALSAAHALRESLGLGDRLLALRRDDVFVLEGMPQGADGAWAEACAAQAAWFNPNTHRHAFFRTAPGALAAARDGSSWPRPWIGGLVVSDRSDLASPGVSCDLAAWLALSPCDDGYAVSIAAWDAEDSVHGLPRGRWPVSGVSVLPLQLWTLALRAEGPQAAEDLALEHALTRARDRGLLIHPHVQRWALVAPAAPLQEAAPR
jgi:hypothetical protein